MSEITTLSPSGLDANYETMLSKLRDPSLRPSEVRTLVSDLTAILAQRAIEPVGPSEQVAVVVILRSGMAMQDRFLSYFPADSNVVIYHLGLFRDKRTLQAVEYYNKLPPRSPDIVHGYILDPLMATGGTAEAAINILRDWGLTKITMVSVLASEKGLSRVRSIWPEGVKVVVGATDGELDHHGYVKPGVGDIGDRLYGTQLL
ncbi:uracil phosphoribosyltransferase [Exophiala spinifera]|uniref:uracil phosphoribosyltransferase n=1 Tax=Exophiala spinifera TaxID=91928 RepID=A0A0D2BB28_9EURO|nr:uracil phosphoribosyltransferase [Exophiala spinifera]KIW15820.1 uracil phosphoribosyltransferase [Exophiala spinifera]